MFCPVGLQQPSASQAQAGMHIWPDFLHLQVTILPLVLPPHAISSIHALGTISSLHALVTEAIVVHTMCKPVAPSSHPPDVVGDRTVISGTFDCNHIFA